MKIHRSQIFKLYTSVTNKVKKNVNVVYPFLIRIGQILVNIVLLYHYSNDLSQRSKVLKYMINDARNLGIIRTYSHKIPMCK